MSTKFVFEVELYPERNIKNTPVVRTTLAQRIVDALSDWAENSESGFFGDDEEGSFTTEIVVRPKEGPGQVVWTL